MNLKPIKRICGVRGCKNTESFTLSKTREFGNSVIICKSCLGQALSEIDSEKVTAAIETRKTQDIPHLFFNHLIGAENEEVEEAIAEPENSVGNGVDGHSNEDIKKEKEPLKGHEEKLKRTVKKRMSE